MDFLKKNSRKSFTSSYIRKLWTWLNMIIWCVVSPLNPSKYEMKVSIIFPPCIDNFHPIIQTTFYLLPEFEESTWSRVTGVPYSKLNVARTRDTWDLVAHVLCSRFTHCLNWRLLSRKHCITRLVNLNIFYSKSNLMKLASQPSVGCLVQVRAHEVSGRHWPRCLDNVDTETGVWLRH